MRIVPFFFAASCILQSAVAQQVADQGEIAAQGAATEILQLLSDQKFKLLWETRTSNWVKSQTSEDAFLAFYSIQRPKLGYLVSSTPISRLRFVDDPRVGFKGEGYVITFKTKYSLGEFYEQVGVAKEKDGQFRLTGLDGAPIPPAAATGSQ